VNEFDKEYNIDAEKSRVMERLRGAVGRSEASIIL